MALAKWIAASGDEIGHRPFLVSSHCGGCVRVDRDRRRWQRSSFLRLQKQHNCVTELFISERRQQWRGNVHHARPEFPAETMLRSYIILVFHAQPRHFGGPNADRHYAKKNQVWRTSSSWQEEAAENTSELFQPEVRVERQLCM